MITRQEYSQQLVKVQQRYFAYTDKLSDAFCTPYGQTGRIGYDEYIRRSQLLRERMKREMRRRTPPCMSLTGGI